MEQFAGYFIPLILLMTLSSFVHGAQAKGQVTTMDHPTHVQSGR